MRRRSLLGGIIGGAALACGGSAQTLDSPARFLVKLSTDLNTKKTRVGDRVAAFVISPERFLGGTFEGAVDRVSATELRFTFQTLRYRTSTSRVTSAILDFVNSKGHKLVDEQERPLQVIDGVVTSKTAGFAIDEGAEFNLQVGPAK